MNKKKTKLSNIILPSKKINFFVVTTLLFGIISGSIFLIILNDADKNNMIAEVEKLPYCMDFYDEDGELDTHQSNGKVVIFKKG